MSEKIAARFEWAMRHLSIHPDDAVLEVGCGHGIALSMVASQLKGGCILGIDRSSKMTALAKKRNAVHGSTVSVQTATLAKAALGSDQFDAVFAINVSLFARDATLELQKLHGHLKPKGRMYLFYESPASTHAGRFLVAAKKNLEENGFSVKTATTDHIGAVLVAQPVRAGSTRSRANQA